MSRRYFFERYRGDSAPFEITVKNRSTGAVVDITGWAFVMTVNSEEDPTNTDNQVFQLTGVITDAANGVVQFTPTTGQTNVTGLHWFDIQATVGGSVETLIKDKVYFDQDISK